MTDTLWQEIIQDRAYNFDEFGVWCEVHKRYHQPREHAVDCAACHRPTFEYHGVCQTCRRY